MTKSHLRACSACARHVRVTEASCPFCGAALSDEFRASPAPQPPRTRLSRAALFAFGTGALALVPGCSSSGPGASTSDDAGPSIQDAAYGGPPYDGPIGEPAYGGGPVEVFEGGGVDAYGGAPLEGGSPTDAGDSGPEDAGDGSDQ